MDTFQMCIIKPLGSNTLLKSDSSKRCTFMNGKSKIFINLCNIVNAFNLLYI